MRLSVLIATCLILVIVASGLFLFLRSTTDEPATKGYSLHIDDTGMTPDKISYNEGDTALLRFMSSRDATIHIHGYNVEVPVSADETAEIELQLTKAGRFQIELHLNDETHEHDHTCQAEVPVGAPPPQIKVKAEQTEEAGNIRISVELENFEFTPQNGENPVATGHWHLFVDDSSAGMFTDTQIITPLDQPGKHQIKASLADTNHCEYGIQNETTILIPGDASHDAPATTEKHDNREQTGDESTATTLLGFLDVQPRNP